MTKGRLEAFSDGVIAIIITIMVLELKTPHEPTVEALRPLAPTFICYALSFVYVAIYWNNHHHLLLACERINGAIMWANMHLLFWLSLVPFVTAWASDSPDAALPDRPAKQRSLRGRDHNLGRFPVKSRIRRADVVYPGRKRVATMTLGGRHGPAGEDGRRVDQGHAPDGHQGHIR